MGVIDSEFSYTDIATLAGTTSTRGGSTSDTDVLVGGFVEGQLAFWLSEKISLFTGAQFQSLPSFEQSTRGKEVQLDLSESVFFVAGVKLHF